jgi:hypothetical protein
MLRAGSVKKRHFSRIKVGIRKTPLRDIPAGANKYSQAANHHQAGITISHTKQCLDKSEVPQFCPSNVPVIYIFTGTNKVFAFNDLRRYFYLSQCPSKHFHFWTYCTPTSDIKKPRKGTV